MLTALLASAALALAPPSDAGAARTLDVTVRALTRPVEGALVCAGVPGDVGRYGHAVTSRTGLARMTGLPDSPVTLVVSAPQGGASVAVGPFMQAVSVNLSASYEGPACTSSASGGSAAPQPLPVRMRLDASAIPRGRLEPIGALPVYQDPRHCFGALGADCGGAQDGIPISALCAAGWCYINAGSWEHDECCEANPNGMACRNGPVDYVTGSDGSCVAEWNKALARLTSGLSWRRRVDFLEPNGTGRVVHGAYCAPSGAVVHRDDARYCCSRATRALTRSERSARGVLGELLADARACR